MRYIAEVAYIGTLYAGWQRQDGALTVQQVFEDAFSLILREQVEITGCGRTDAGVHAQQYFFHFDTQHGITDQLIHRLNSILPPELAIFAIRHVADTAHARFDAVRRTYQYFITFRKDPLHRDTAYWYARGDMLEREAMQRMAAMLLEYRDFRSFCKTGSDAEHYLCDLSDARWSFEEHKAVFTISSNRFLRGMVRLIVGSALEVGRGRLTIDDVRKALDTQMPVPRAVSAPAHGLHLVRIEYGDI